MHQGLRDQINMEILIHAHCSNEKKVIEEKLQRKESTGTTYF